MLMESLSYQNLLQDTGGNLEETVHLMKKKTYCNFFWYRS